MILCISFGTLLASIIESFISNQGGLSAVATLVSSLYGFLCGAYMPISQFGAGIRNFVMFIPGTYGVVLFRNYYMNGVLDEFSGSINEGLMLSIKDSFDANVYFFGNRVEIWQMYLILIASIVILLGIYLFVVFFRKKKN
jgi:multidrug/hemolysin transport system permease protein